MRLYFILKYFFFPGYITDLSSCFHFFGFLLYFSKPTQMQSEIFLPVGKGRSFPTTPQHSVVNVHTGQELHDLIQFTALIKGSPIPRLRTTYVSLSDIWAAEVYFVVGFFFPKESQSSRSKAGYQKTSQAGAHANSLCCTASETAYSAE